LKQLGSGFKLKELGSGSKLKELGSGSKLKELGSGCKLKQLGCSLGYDFPCYPHLIILQFGIEKSKKQILLQPNTLRSPKPPLDTPVKTTLTLDHWDKR
jgi:hypothetical protein